MRGREEPIGAQRKSPNGYLYEKTERGWILVHRLIAEKMLGRQLTANEFVIFRDGDRTNFNPSNLLVRLRGVASLRTRLARIEAQIAELEAVRDELKERIRIRTEIASTEVQLSH